MKSDLSGHKINSCGEYPKPINQSPFQFDSINQIVKYELISEQRITARLFREFLLSAAMAKISDVTLQTNLAPRLEINGTLYILYGREWSISEIEDILEETYGATSGIAEIRSQKVLDYSYEIPSSNGQRQRFRVNVTGIYGVGGFGIELTFRILPEIPPTVSEVGLTPTEINLMSPNSGLVIIAGATGSGKSTTMAALTRHLLERRHPSVKIIDIQAPIEFTYLQVMNKDNHSSSLIGQSEIGRHLPNFAAGVRSALRRKPHIIMIGEARDHETISAVIEASLTGHLVYTTSHASSVHDCIRRLLASFPSSEIKHRAADLASSLRFVLAQQLIPDNSSNGRIALREWMSFQQSGVRSLISIPHCEWPRFIMQSMLASERQSKAFAQNYESAAKNLVQRGKISARTAALFINQQATE